MVDKYKVGLVQAASTVYPGSGPFNPDTNYPEYPFKGYLSQQNHAYKALRELFKKLLYDSENMDTVSWNPLGNLIKPGMRVVIKPNFVLSAHRFGKDLYSIITHPAVLRAITDYCWIALKGLGEIIIADAPQYNCNFNQLLEVTQLSTLIPFYNQFGGPLFTISDLRNYWSPGKHFPSLCRSLPGDTQGKVLVNLDGKSALYGKASDKFYGAVYHRQETIDHHNGERQEYQISKTMLSADILISVPKMKVHKKVGVTLNIKGLVGTATSKNLLVHYTLGTPSIGGDQFPDNFLKPHERFLIRLERFFYDTLLAKRSIPLEYIHRFFYIIHSLFTRKLGLTVGEYKGYKKRIFDAGNWYGNDTCWRMSADLAKIIYFADTNGSFHQRQQRALLTIIDGIIGGEGQGPLEPDPKRSGILLCSENLLAADIVATRLMGFNPFILKMYDHLLNNQDFDFGVHNADNIKIISDNELFCNCLYNKQDRFFNYEPHPGWKGHIEINPKEEERII
ncbi:MAG: DUF362 domain-containing protein [Treponema sp.]|jgi:uncharacterized protein (DUF362 family)|nr:DUF362 domain-containing protein [Treponema sp.]